MIKIKNKKIVPQLILNSFNMLPFHIYIIESLCVKLPPTSPPQKKKNLTNPKKYQVKGNGKNTRLQAFCLIS